jgi:hypothetical protein
LKRSERLRAAGSWARVKRQPPSLRRIRPDQGRRRRRGPGGAAASLRRKGQDCHSFRHLRGPNIWTYRPILEAWVDIGELEDCPSNKSSPASTSGWSPGCPNLIEHRCSVGERGGFLQRLREGTWPGHILEHVTLELQNLAGMPGGFGKARQTQRGVYKVVVRASRRRRSPRRLLHGPATC